MAGSQTVFRMGLVQMRAGKNVGENLAQALDQIREAASQGARYVQTPENTLVMETDARSLLDKIETEEKTEAIADFSQLARELRIWLHIGSIAVKAGDGRAANRALLFSPDGSLVCRYDKIHMFDVNLPSGESYRESATFKPGNKAIVVELPWGRLGIATCYDIRFPEHYKALAKAGAKFLTAPSAFTKVTGEAHWHMLLRARAIENGCFVFAAAQGGRHENGRSTYGHSMAVSPWGEVLVEAGTEPGVFIADIDAAEVERVRQRIPSLDHSRDFTVESVSAPDHAMETAI
jgi:deaminated glutathione amidase